MRPRIAANIAWVHSRAGLGEQERPQVRRVHPLCVIGVVVILQVGHQPPVGAEVYDKLVFGDLSASASDSSHDGSSEASGTPVGRALRELVVRPRLC